MAWKDKRLQYKLLDTYNFYITEQVNPFRIKTIPSLQFLMQKFMDIFKQFIYKLSYTLFNTFSNSKTVTPLVPIDLCLKTEIHFNKFFDAEFLVLMQFQDSSTAH